VAAEAVEAEVAGAAGRVDVDATPDGAAGLVEVVALPVPVEPVVHGVVSAYATGPREMVSSPNAISVTGNSTSAVPRRRWCHCRVPTGCGTGRYVVSDCLLSSAEISA
jgi:hypothetical protein